MAAEIDPHNQILEDKIKAVLKLLTFREQRVLVQFWSPCDAGKHQLFTTTDQPFGLGVNHDERLLSYRRVSQHNLYVVDKDYEEEVDFSPLARVFKLGLSEWSSDLTNYLPKHFPQQECAIRCNLNGCLVLPMFDSITRLCVGMLELLASSKYTSFDYEVQQFEMALKTQKLTCLQLQVLDDPASNLKNEVAERFKLKSQLIRLNYKDEDNDLILLCGDYDLQPALVASGSGDFRSSDNVTYPYGVHL
ncbi:NIN-like protein [Artemisia annua]|uniref:NIN-like protein n=1 Tax=Artemisia annua TaxID=35608 RepID=A0A2U1M807_ARTAN|nr:NIN-like protein [Artemisia annua]